MPYLLDTNILSALLRHPSGQIAQRLGRHAADEVCTSIIAASELRFGAVKCGSAKLSTAVEGLLARLQTMPFESPADRFYAQVRTHLETAGTPIGANDMLIAAHTLALDCTLVTDNDREFSRIEGLRIENWLR
jgi:tRNA(fMet)-specific endonuclease VapC